MGRARSIYYDHSEEHWPLYYTVILEYVLSEPRSYCLVTSQTSSSLVQLAALGAIESLSNDYLKAIKAQKQGTAEAQKLYALLIQPIAELVKGKHLTVIVRDGLLHLLRSEEHTSE